MVCLVRSTGIIQTVTREQFGMLRLCNSFRPIEIHAQEIQKLTPTNSYNEVLASLAALTSRGLLMEKGAVIASLSSVRGDLGSEDPGRGKKPYLAMPSKDRAHQAAVSLHSYVEDAKLHSQPLSIVLMDYSTSPTSGPLYKQILRNLSKNSGTSTTYIDLAARRHFFSAAIKRGAPEAMLQFATMDPHLPGYSIDEKAFLVAYGAARNSLLLQDPGTCFVSVDDDTICAIKSPPCADNLVRISSARDLTEFWPNDSPEGATKPQQQSFCEHHQSAVGRSVNTLISEVDHLGLDIEGLDEETIKSISQGGRVRLTMTGVRGDMGMYTTGHVLYRHETQLSRLCSTSAGIRSVFLDRSAIRSSHRLSIGPIERCMATTMGLDNRVALPPFVPVQRNEDAVFAQLVRITCEGAFVAQLPFTIGHSPVPKRSCAWKDIETSTAIFRCNDVLLTLLSAIRYAPGSGYEARMAQVGRYLTDLAMLPTYELLAIIRERCLAILRNRLEAAARNLTCDSLVPEIRDKLREQPVLIERAMLSPWFGVPGDLLWRGDLDDVMDLFKRIVKDYGTLIHHWPELIYICRKVSEDVI